MSSDRSSKCSFGVGYKGTHPHANPLCRKHLYPVLVVKEVHVERGEQGRCQVLGVEPGVYVSLAGRGPQEPEDDRAAPVVRGVREALQTICPAQRFVATVEQVQVLHCKGHEPVQERVELLDGRRPWFTKDLQRLLLEMLGRLVEKRLAEKALVWKAPVECALPDTRGPG